MRNRNILLVLAAVLVLAACGGNTATGPSQSGPAPTPPMGNPPNVPVEERVFTDSISVDDPAVCDPFSSSGPNTEGGFRVCKKFSVIPGADGLLDFRLDWSPAEPGARNALAVYSECVGSISSGSESRAIGGANLSGTSVKAGQPCPINVYVYPGGAAGRSNFTLRVNYPK